MTKITLNLDNVWAEALSDAAHSTKVSVNEYLRQLIARDLIVAEIIAGKSAPPISKTWGRRKVTEHAELKAEVPTKVTDVPEHTEVKVTSGNVGKTVQVPARAFRPVPKPESAKKPAGRKDENGEDFKS